MHILFEKKIKASGNSVISDIDIQQAIDELGYKATFSNIF